MTDVATRFGAELRRRRLAAGLPQAELGARIHYAKAQISKVENGHARPARAFAEACDLELQAGGALIALANAETPRSVGSISGLPAATRHFTGRGDERARVRAALTSQDQAPAGVVLAGMAGVGKTALAVRAAWDVESAFPDGCLFFDLHGYSPGVAGVASADALDRLLRTLGVSGTEIPPDEDGRANLYRDRLRHKRMLLVFDNVSSPAQVIPLLPPDCGSRVLVTSRSRLAGLDDATHVAVGPLPAAAAVALFRSVVEDHNGMPDADEALEEVIECCGRLPLAVRIAAARFRHPQWTFETFARRLGDEAARLETLDDGDRSVAATFQLSYQGLPPQQQRLFGLLALHPGSDISASSAAALAGLPLAETKRLLDRLTEAHLIVRSRGGYCEFHDLVRLFAASRALPAIPQDEQDAAVARLLDLTLHRTAAADRLLAPQRYRPPRLAGTEPDEAAADLTDWQAALSWLDREWPNLVVLCEVAAHHGRHAHVWQLAFLLRDFFFRTKLWDPWIETHRRAVDAAEAIRDTPALAKTVNNLGLAYADRGDLDLARQTYDRALTLFRDAGDEFGTTNAVANLAWVNLYLGDHESALRDMRIVLDVYRRQGQNRNVAITLRGVALAEVELGSFAEARRHARESLEAGGETELEAAMALNCLAWVDFQEGRHDDARTNYEKAWACGERGRSTVEAARALTGLGNLAAVAEDPAGAAELWAKAVEWHPPLNPVNVGEERVRQLLGKQAVLLARQPPN